jgi:hypothetical protein
VAQEDKSFNITANEDVTLHLDAYCSDILSDQKSKIHLVDTDPVGRMVYKEIEGVDDFDPQLEELKKACDNITEILEGKKIGGKALEKIKALEEKRETTYEKVRRAIGFEKDYSSMDPYDVFKEVDEACSHSGLNMKDFIWLVITLKWPPDPKRDGSCLANTSNEVFDEKTGFLDRDWETTSLKTS